MVRFDTDCMIACLPTSRLSVPSPRKTLIARQRLLKRVSEDIDQSDTKPSRKRVVGITVLVVLFIIAMIAAGIALFVNHSIAQGRRKFEDSMQHMIDQSGSTIEHDGVTYRLNENMVTVAFIGFDDRTVNGSSGDPTTGQSDTIMVLALNADTGKSTCILYSA